MAKTLVRDCLNLIKEDDWLAEYALDFCIFAAESGWNDAALRNVYKNGLKRERHVSTCLIKIIVLKIFYNFAPILYFLI